MKIIEIPIEKLKFNKNHLRINLNKNDKMFQCLVSSIMTFGLQLPLSVNKDYEVIAGNQILRVLRFLAYKTVPCIISDIDKEKETKLFIALNKIKTDWYISNLRKYFRNYRDSEKELEVLGFEKLEIDSLMALDKFPDLDEESNNDNQLKIF